MSEPKNNRTDNRFELENKATRTAEEILQHAFHKHVREYYPELIDAMEEYANQFKTQKEDLETAFNAGTHWKEKYKKRIPEHPPLGFEDQYIEAPDFDKFYSDFTKGKL